MIDQRPRISVVSRTSPPIESLKKRSPFTKDRCSLTVFAFVLMNVDPGKLWTIAKRASEVEDVKICRAVTGLYDVIAYIETPDLDRLGKLVQKIQKIDGVQRTHTSISIPEPIRE